MGDWLAAAKCEKVGWRAGKEKIQKDRRQSTGQRCCCNGLQLVEGTKNCPPARQLQLHPVARMARQVLDCVTMIEMRLGVPTGLVDAPTASMFIQK